MHQDSLDSPSLDQQYWDNRYQNGTASWDLQQVSPPLKNYIDQIQNKNLSVLIPGAGNAYEAKYLLEQGFTNITVLDIAPSVVASLQKQFENNPNIKIIEADFFQHMGQYDLILEQTFFCALPPSLRPQYAHKMHQLLKSGGKLAGLLFNKQFEVNPPFGGTALEYRKLFGELFEIKTMEACTNSISPRQGSELFIIFIQKKG
jgi:SAM-dependent methyltransferase